MEDRKMMDGRDLAEALPKTLDVVIPTYNPGEKFGCLLEMLQKQTYPIQKIIIINTEKSFWNTKYEETVPNLEVYHVTKEEFDHGATRNRGASYSEADYILFMTDDAMPRDKYLTERLIKSFTGHMISYPVIMAYARQLADQDCREVERFTRIFNYPGQSRIKTKADLPEMGIKTFFASNVCCIYDRAVFQELGGFIEPAIFNEDMIFAGNAVKLGYAVAYVADAQVIHSHNYTHMQQFRRNFDLAVSQVDHPEVFAGIRSESEGIRLVKRTIKYLLDRKTPWLIPGLIVGSGFKYMGYRMGKNYKRLSEAEIRACTMNPEYWSKREKEKRK